MNKVIFSFLLLLELSSPDTLANPLLIKSATLSNPKQLKTLLSRNSTEDYINERDAEGLAPIDWAILYDRVENVSLLLSHKANINHTFGPLTTLSLAAVLNRKKTVELLIQAGADVNYRQAQPYGVLYWAAIGGDKPLIVSLLRAGMNTEATVTPLPSPAQYPIPIAACVSNSSVARLLKSMNFTLLKECTLKQKAANAVLLRAGKIFYRSMHRFTSSTYTLRHPYYANFAYCKLLSSISNQNVSELKNILAQNPSPDFVNHVGDDGDFPLILSAIYESAEIVQVLLDNKADPNQVSLRVGTALQVAAFMQRPGSVAALLKAGANPDIATEAADTPLILASGQGNQAVVELLLQYSPNINALNIDGENAYTLAYCSGHKELAEFLLKKGVTKIDDCSFFKYFSTRTEQWFNKKSQQWLDRKIKEKDKDPEEKPVLQETAGT